MSTDETPEFRVDVDWEGRALGFYPPLPLPAPVSAVEVPAETWATWSAEPSAWRWDGEAACLVPCCAPEPPPPPPLTQAEVLARIEELRAQVESL